MELPEQGRVRATLGTPLSHIQVRVLSSIPFHNLQSTASETLKLDQELLSGFLFCFKVRLVGGGGGARGTEPELAEGEGRGG